MNLDQDTRHNFQSSLLIYVLMGEPYQDTRHNLHCLLYYVLMGQPYQDTRHNLHSLLYPALMGEPYQDTRHSPDIAVLQCQDANRQSSLPRHRSV